MARIKGSMKALVEDITREAETRGKSVAWEHNDPQLAVDYLDEMADVAGMAVMCACLI